MNTDKRRRIHFLHLCLSVFICGQFFFSGCDDHSGPAHDFSTPEGAILKLEDAYRARDIDAAVLCKDFKREAELLLTDVSKDKLTSDPQILTKTAQLLELGFRKELREKGFPDLRGVKCTFTAKRDAPSGIVVVTEVCRYPDGKTSTQNIQCSKTDKGWRVLVPLEKQPDGHPTRAN